MPPSPCRTCSVRVELSISRSSSSDEPRESGSPPRATVNSYKLPGNLVLTSHLCTAVARARRTRAKQASPCRCTRSLPTWPPAQAPRCLRGPAAAARSTSRACRIHDHRGASRRAVRLHKVLPEHVVEEVVAPAPGLALCPNGWPKGHPLVRRGAVLHGSNAIALDEVPDGLQRLALIGRRHADVKAVSAKAPPQRLKEASI